MVAAAGNVRHDDAGADARATAWTRAAALGPSGTSSWNLRARGAAPRPSGARLIKRRKTEQAHICWGPNGLLAHRPRPVRVLDREHGARAAGCRSRLFQEIREKRGLAYTVYSYHAQYTEAGLFSAYAGTHAGAREGGRRR